MTTSSPIQFGWNLPLAPTGVVPIPKGELTMINTDPHNQKKKDLILVPTPREKTMWVHPDIVQSQQWTIVTNRKSKGKANASSSNVVSISTRETEKDVAPLVVQETRNPPLLLTQAHFPHQRFGLVSSTWNGTASWCKLPTASWGNKRTIHEAIRGKAEELRYVKALQKGGVGPSTPFCFDVMAQLTNVPAQITLYELLRLFKFTRDTLREALADARFS